MRAPTQIPTALRTKVIRDNIHGYIALTEIERGFLAQPEFHRLHFISQNGLAFDTYPATKHTRFLHSLGAMHLAGRILISAMRKETPSARSLRDALNKYISQKHAWLFADVRKVVARDALYSDLGIAKDELLCIMFQAVRLASLIHDIGHPPFSHTVEEAMQLMTAGSGTRPSAGGQRAVYTEHHEALQAAIEKLPTRPGALHERVGEYLVHDIMIPRLAGDLHLIGSRIVDFAIEISAHYEVDPTLRALKGIVDGEFDCDRADYVLRDCAAAGVDFGGYDLERIVPEMTVVEDDGRWYFRPTLRALSAIEAFYEERSKLYRWIVFHHSCVRSHIALQRTTIGAIRLSQRSNGFTSDEIKALERFAQPVERLWEFEHYRICDESWYFAFLASLLDEIDGYIARSDEARVHSDALLDLQGYGNQARWRTKGMFPIWKSIEGYREFCSGVLEGRTNSDRTGSAVPLSQVIPTVSNWLHSQLYRPLRDEGISFWEWLEQELAESCGRSLALHLTHFKHVGEDRAVVEQRRGSGVFLVDEANEARASNRLIPLADVSPIPDALATVWENSIRFRAYALGWNSPSGTTPTARSVGAALGALIASDRFAQLWHPLAPTTPHPQLEGNTQ